MNREEARQVLAQVVSRYQARTYDDLLYLLDAPDTSDITAESGTNYQLEVQAVWDDEEGGSLRVVGSIDDGGLRAFLPITEDFVVDRSANSVGE